MIPVEQWAESLAGTVWIYAVMYVFTAVDGFFPPFPSESLLIALTAMWRATGSPIIGWVMVAGALGAFTGDQIAYRIGRRVPVHRLRIFRGRRGQAALAWAHHALEHRGASFIIGARYIPIGRVAVNMTAGALGYPLARFMVIDAFASVTWAVYSAGIGVVAGAVLGHNPLLAVAVGVVAGGVLGLLLDRVLQRFTPMRLEVLDPPGRLLGHRAAPE